MAWKHILLDHEKVRLTFLCYKFGELLPVYLPRVVLTRMIHELVFDVSGFVEEHGTVGLFSEEEGESLHHEITFEYAQLFCVRSDPKILRLVVEQHEQRLQADCSLLSYITTKETCKKYKGQCLGVLFFHFNFFHCCMYEVPIIQHHFFLVYIVIGLNWFDLVGGNGCWCWS